MKGPSIIPYGFLPDTPEFRALLRDCTSPEIRHKFEQLAAMNPRARRAEVGSAVRLAEPIFNNPELLLRCREGYDFEAHLARGGVLILEGAGADEDAIRLVSGGVNLRITEYCEGRQRPYPPVLNVLDECTNARTAGIFEEKKAGETRKAGEHWAFICQHPNFPGGPDGYFQNCQEQHFYRTGDYTLARKLASFVAGMTRRGDEQSRADLLEDIVTDLMTFKPGWRYTVGPGGARKEYVPMLPEPWPDWPGLREAKLQEKLCQIRSRPEYRTQAPPPPGDPGATSGATSPSDTPSPSSNSPASTSPAERWKRGRKKLPGSSPDTETKSP